MQKKYFESLDNSLCGIKQEICLFSMSDFKIIVATRTTPSEDSGVTVDTSDLSTVAVVHS